MPDNDKETPSGQTMTDTITRFWEWLTGRKRSREDAWWRQPVQTRSIWEVSETPDSSAPAEPQNAIPLGSRFRPPSSDFSPTVGQMEEMNRLVRMVRPLPQGALKVMQELDSAAASAASVGEAIACEPVIAASVVRIANSSAIGLRREITSVSEAVAYLGFSTTKSLLLRYNMSAALPGARPGQGYDSGKLWVHSMAVAQVAEEIARRAGQTDASLALTAGLVHDIGKLVINSQYRRALDQLWSPANDPNESLLDRERRLFQADHAIIGATLATEWKLPSDLTEIIRRHHMAQDQASDLPPQTRRALLCVQIANQLVKHRHVYCEGMEIDEVPQAMTSELGLPDWNTLLNDSHLRTIIDRVILLNSGSSESPAAAA